MKMNVIISHKDLSIKKMEEIDLDDIYSLFNSNNQKHLFFHGDVPREEFLQYCFSTRMYTYSLPLVIKYKQEFIGSIIFNDISFFTKSANFRFLVIKEECQKRTLGMLAANLVISLFFKETDVRRINAQTWANNPVMDKLYTKYGFKLEGIRRKDCLIDEEWVDLKLWGLLKEEYDFKLIDKLIGE